MKQPEAYRGLPVVVLGMARSGVAVAKCFHQAGANVTVNDQKEREKCPEADELTALGISVVCGGHPASLFQSGVALVVKNPGIPYSAPPVRLAQDQGIEIVTEVEVAYRISKAPIIGITGSNGKTTTTTWVGSMLEEAGFKPIVAGNIGRALCDAALEATDDNWLVAELSSFQLKGTDQFRPRIACLTNVYETHLDYHGSMDDYIASKAKLFANQTPEDTAVLNWENDTCRLLATHVRGRLFPFSHRETLEEGVFLQDGVITVRTQGETHAILPATELGVPGGHNIENALAATAIAFIAGASAEAIAQALRTFRGVEHRLEFVAERNGVTYINGSKATNPAATIMDLKAFNKPIVLIAGGQERKMEYTDLLPYLKEKVRAVVAIGETRHKIAGVAEEAGLRRVKIVDTANNPADVLVEAIRIASSFAEAGDVVLLSPACASWDMFASYEERGRMFKESVHTL